MENHGVRTLEAEFDRTATDDDDAAAREILASGMPIHIVRSDTPPDHVVRIHPDGREETVSLDRDAAAEILGR